MSFQPGEKVFVEAKVLSYIDNDPTAPKPYYQLILPNNNVVVVALCDYVKSRRIELIHDADLVVDGKEFKQNHFR